MVKRSDRVRRYNILLCFWCSNNALKTLEASNFRNKANPTQNFLLSIENKNLGKRRKKINQE